MLSPFVLNLKIQNFFYIILIYNILNLEVRECLLLLGAESFFFQFAIQKVKDQYIQNYNIARCSVWV